MNFFKTDYFTFNGRNSRDLQIIMCSTNEDGNEFNLGGLKNIVQSDGITDLKSLNYVNNDYLEIPFTITRYENGNMLPITYEILFEIERWLNTKNFCALEFNGLSVNLMIKSMSLVQYNQNDVGYIKCIAWAEPYMTNSIRKSYKIIEENTFEIYNKSNTDNSCINQLDIQLYEGDYFKITNLTNNKKFFLENIDNGSKLIRIMSDEYRFVYSLEDSSKNIYRFLTNKEWDTFKLAYGRNLFKIETNKSKVDLLWKEKLFLM